MAGTKFSREDPDVTPMPVDDAPGVPLQSDRAASTRASQLGSQLFQVPSAAVVAYNSGQMPPDVRAELDADLKAGRAQLPSGMALSDPDDMPVSDLMHKLGLTARDVMEGMGKKLGIEPGQTAEFSAGHTDGYVGHTNYSIPAISPKVTLQPLTDNRSVLACTLFQRAQQYQQALHEAFQNPTAANFAMLARLFPGQHAGLTKGRNSVRPERRKSELENAARAFVALSSNELQLARTIVQEHLAALHSRSEELTDPAYAQEVRSVQDMLKLIQSNPKAAQGLLGAVLSSAMSADEFSTRFSLDAPAQGASGSEELAMATKSAQPRYTHQRPRRRNPAWRTATRNLCR